MSTYPLKTLLRQWARGDLTTEQAVGQILQFLVKLQESIQEVENRLLRWEQRQRHAVALLRNPSSGFPAEPYR